MLVIAAVAFLLLPLTPLAERQSLELVGLRPWMAVAYLCLHFLAVAFGTFAGTLGAMICPAAVSATTFTGMGMVFGYAAQVAFFDQAPDFMTFVGAFLILCAVVIMTLFRVQQPPSQQDPDRQENVACDKEVPPEVPAESHDDELDNESLGSFVASEFAEFKPHEVHTTIRVRRSIAQPKSSGAPDMATVVRAVSIGAV